MYKMQALEVINIEMAHFRVHRDYLDLCTINTHVYIRVETFSHKPTVTEGKKNSFLTHLKIIFLHKLHCFHKKEAKNVFTPFILSHYLHFIILMQEQCWYYCKCTHFM